MIALSPGERAVVEAILRRRVPDCKVWAFGSRVRGGARPFSDLDLAISAPRALSLGVLAELAEDFEESPLDFRVDILDWDAASSTFREKIAPDLEPIQTS